YVVGINSSFIDTENELNAFAVAGGHPDPAYPSVPVPVLQDGFESGNFSGGSYTTSGNANWFVGTSSTNSGTYSAHSGNIGDNGVTRLALALNMPDPGLMEFAVRVSSEFDFDVLSVLVDGQSVLTGSGNVLWQDAPPLRLPAGPHTVTFEYAKDGSVSSGTDTAYIDDIDVYTSLPAYYDAQNTA